MNFHIQHKGFLDLCDALSGFGQLGAFSPLNPLNRGLPVQPGSQGVRIWQSLPHNQGVRVSSDPIISPQLSLLAHPMTQLSPQSKFLPLKWGWVFDLPSEEDLSSQGCPGVWTGLEVT